jgi:aspartyl protease family protein
MNDENREETEQKRMGASMIAAMWVIFLIILMFFFNNILEKQHNPNQNINSRINTNSIKELSLERNRSGHYVTSGSINNTSVTFMLDTGATDVAIPEHIADDIGLKKGRKAYYQTANGNAPMFMTQLNSISIGDIAIKNIRATINPNTDSDDILLGMAFLKHIEFTQRGNTLTLRQYPR